MPDAASHLSRPAPDAQAILDDPAASFALKAVVRDWLTRDCVDAAHDARRLCTLFEGRAEEILVGQP